MTMDQRQFLADQIWDHIYSRSWSSFTAKQVNRDPNWLGQLVRNGWLDSWRARPYHDRHYRVTRAGFYALVGVYGGTAA